jgi:hypothetical protein
MSQCSEDHGCMILSHDNHGCRCASCLMCSPLPSMHACMQVLFLDGGRGGGGLAEYSEPVARKRMYAAVETCMEGLMQVCWCTLA